MKDEEKEINNEENEIKEENAVVAVETAPAENCSCGKKTHPVGAIVLGVLSMCCGVSFCSFPLSGIVMGIIGIVLGSRAKKGNDNPALGKAGMILSIIGLVFNVLSVIMFGALGVLAFYAFERLPQVGYYVDNIHFMF